MYQNKQKKYPIGQCPNCHRNVLYSDNPKEKNNIRICLDTPDYHGSLHMCPRCNAMYRVIENPVVAVGYTAIPIIQADDKVI